MIRGSHHSTIAREKNKLAHIGRETWMKGKKHNENARQKNRAAHLGRRASERTRRKMSLSHSGVAKGPCSEETKRKMSKAKAILIADGSFQPGKGGHKTGYFHSVKNQQNIYYGSSYELAAFVVLEQLHIVVGYKRCHTSVPYVNVDGKLRLYTPDILVEYTDGTKEVIEVKPKCFVNDDTNVRKCIFAEEFFYKQGIKFSVWMEKELKLVS